MAESINIAGVMQMLLEYIVQEWSVKLQLGFLLVQTEYITGWVGSLISGDAS